ncbi:MAG: acetyltransferase [Vampirovibrio sp.]|jgi:acetyltransferase-like isoleucine patch superfamily enzyme|nr:acetyltransferase [Vampirovibrio sp.]
MPKYLQQPPANFPDGQTHHIPANKYNAHCWITGEPEIGENTWIGAFVLIDGQGGLSIGKGCDISCGAAILTHSTVKRCVTERAYGQVDQKPTVVEDHVFIGENAVVMMGCRIGHHSIIGAGAVVLEDTVIPPYSMVVGVPGRVIRTIEDDIEQWTQEWKQQKNNLTSLLPNQP